MAAAVTALVACSAEPLHGGSAPKAPDHRPSPAATASAESASTSARARMRSAMNAVMKTTALEGPDRGTVRAILPVDLASLPRLERPSTSGAAHQALGRFEVTRDGKPTLPSNVVAEVNARGYRAFLPATQAPVSPLRKDVNLPILTSAPGCVPGGYGTADLVTIDLMRPSAWSKTELTLSRLEGRMDWSKCSGSLERSATVRARAVIPNVVYAFVAPGTKGEELSVIGPPAEWVATSTANPAEQLDPHVGTFTRLEAPLVRGRSTTILLNVSGASLAHFLGLRGEKPAWEKESMSVGPIVSFSVEVIWPADSDTPQGRVYAFSLEPGGDQVLAALGLAADPRL
jgi:hypothetical protein